MRLSGRRQTLPERPGHLAQQREVQLGTGLDAHAQGIKGTGPDRSTFDDGVHEALVEVRLVEHTGHAQLAHFLAEFPNPLDARRALGADHRRTGGAEAEAVLEVPVSVVKHDERNAARGREIRRDIFDQVLELVEMMVRVVRIPCGIGRVHLGQNAGNRAGLCYRIHRIEPYVEIEGTFFVGVVLDSGVMVVIVVVVVPVRAVSVVMVAVGLVMCVAVAFVVPVVLLLMVAMVVFVVFISVTIAAMTVIASSAVIMVMVHLEGTTFPKRPADEADCAGKLHHPRIAGEVANLGGEGALHRVIDEEGDIRLFKHCRV